MKLQVLKNKLAKMNIEFKTWSPNNFNFSLIFSVNGKQIEADYNNDENNTISSFSHDKGFNECTQERNRYYMNSFNEVLRFAGLA